MVDRNHKELSISSQCNLLSISRSSYYYSPIPETEYNLELMKIIDKEYLKYLFLARVK